MPLNLRWVGEPDLDRVADTRLHCYASTATLATDYRQQIRADSRAQPGDFLLIEDGSEAVGTSTSLSFNMWVRGSSVPCQGVAWVGTIRTHRRRGPKSDSPGIASQLMQETIRKGRERGQVLSALMPFRASFYEHFGYGIVERQCAWTIPLDILPTGPCNDFRFATPADLPAIAACYQRTVERGHGCIERSPTRWTDLAAQPQEGFQIIDTIRGDTRRGTGALSSPLDVSSRPESVCSFLQYSQYQECGKDILRVTSHFADDLPAFLRQLHFLATLRDQYRAVHLRLPADFPLHWLLKERQIPHRLVNHPTAEPRPYTKMQVRVLDHARLLEAMHWPADVKGTAVIAVHETEGHVSRFQVDVADGIARVTPSNATAEVECSSPVWAALSLGDLPVQRAATMGLITLSSSSPLPLLTALSTGPAPYNEEYF